jgi:hypothetical protein
MVFFFANTKCYSVRYDLERNLLNSLYHNITGNQLQSFRLLERQFKELGQRRVESNVAFDAIAMKQEASLGMADQISSLSKKNVDAVKYLSGRLGESAKVVEMMYTSLAKAGGDSLDALAKRNDETLDRGMGSIAVKIKEHFDIMVGIVEGLSKSLNGLNDDVERSLLLRVDRVDDRGKREDQYLKREKARDDQEKAREVEREKLREEREKVREERDIVQEERKKLLEEREKVLEGREKVQEDREKRERIKYAEWGGDGGVGSFFLKTTGLESHVTQGMLLVLHAALVFCILLIAICSPASGISAKGWILVIQSVSFGSTVYLGRFFLKDIENIYKAGIVVMLSSFNTSSLIFWLLVDLSIGKAIVLEEEIVTNE